MYRIHKQALAEEDIQGIWLYTYEKWGEAQADKYFDELEYGIKTIGHNPAIGKNCDAIREGYRSFQINRHIVYYKVKSSTIHIVRVLHERMDPMRHLENMP